MISRECSFAFCLVLILTKPLSYGYDEMEYVGAKEQTDFRQIKANAAKMTGLFMACCHGDRNEAYDQIFRPAAGN